MRFEAWLAGLWDGDGTKYIIKRRHRKQVDYFVKILTTSFLEVKRIIEFFDKVFKGNPITLGQFIKRTGRDSYLSHVMIIRHCLTGSVKND